ncbi:carbamoyl-phosphate synthase [Candidatus Rickettsiella viridis]|uniref:Carbamoyl phosphate synthase arginine-specific large chain n=1 Tax=Candidatus Rickettsiella viridis TaxID=676208 RepID=A0A2Z5UUJ3_9COXI|nr:carbamoyl-phosphate synthase (glutamine-hydrolyzing) large subunit [Candidatus Rickettsiella viridis]BBB14705.1 carbamoyl-phosphate synthase [Candidatus Rickettsiella viridis]
MKKQFKGKKILILGSGGLRIGQAGEFDYSGSQAIKALKQENIKTVLINPNIATVQTDASLADEVYLQPLNFSTVERIIAKEKPDGILLGFGGQTALNLGLQLEEKGVLKKHKVTVLGSSVESIRQTEDRDLFKLALKKIEVKTPLSIAAKTVQQALKAAEKIGYPVMLRSGFSLGGLGSGKIPNKETLEQRAHESLVASPQILIEEYLFGWKEFEYEIVRDRQGNGLTICNMENMDAMGIHTGESIVVAPAQTLSNAQHQFLRNIALKAADCFNIIGECNIQFAINPENGDYRVIEMNARLSRSSALASKATGYPLAFIATKLALGYCLHELKNTVTQVTCAYFEPALDYIVVKIPRWDIQKLKAAERTIGTEMKSVGEVMAIGRSFPEALQKAVGMLNIGASCLSDYSEIIKHPEKEVQVATDRRLFALYQFFLQGGSVTQAQKLSQIDLWFLAHIHAIADLEKQLTQTNLNQKLLLQLKQSGFSDQAIAQLKNKSVKQIRSLRLKHKIIPYVKQIDTLAGEFAAQTNYLYLSYHAVEHDIKPAALRPIVVLGSGPYAIGSSVEFDWCAVNTVQTLRRLKETAIIINSNPETVSTDYDESDRLYFEQLTFERIQDIVDFEQAKGIIVSVGGQIANNLVLPLAKAGYPLLGTDSKSIDQAENREKFSALLNKLAIDQPAWERITSLKKAKAFAAEVGYPVLIRPSYILSGAAMNVVYDPESLQQHLQAAALVSQEHPVVISKFVEEAKELEIDGVAQQGEIVIEAISEHIENAGVHSGDATVVLPPQKLYLETIRRTKKIARQIVKALNITGPFNIQFIAKNNDIQVIECNLRASRSFPFVSKVTGHNLIQIATEVMLAKHQPQQYETLELDYVGVKAAQFSYSRLKGANPVAQVEMASTGEVACIADDLVEAFYKAWLATDQTITEKKILLSIADNYKAKLLPWIKQLDEQGWLIYSTAGTHQFLSQQDIKSSLVNKTSEAKKPNIKHLIGQRKVAAIINIPSSATGLQRTDGFVIRRLAIDHHIPLVTNAQITQVFLQGLVTLWDKELPVDSWQSLVGKNS